MRSFGRNLTGTSRMTPYGIRCHDRYGLPSSIEPQLPVDVGVISVLRAVRHSPFPRVLDRTARWQGRPKDLDGWQRLHRLPPPAKGRVLGIHGLALLREAEG